MNEYVLIAIGQLCKNFRKSLGLTQVIVSDETGYSIESVSGFENGRNDNLRILLWYINRGINIQDILNIWSEELDNK